VFGTPLNARLIFEVGGAYGIISTIFFALYILLWNVENANLGIRPHPFFEVSNVHNLQYLGVSKSLLKVFHVHL
jgi:hypothetical protein